MMKVVLMCAPSGQCQVLHDISPDGAPSGQCQTTLSCEGSLTLLLRTMSGIT